MNRFEWIPTSERLPDYNGYDEVLTVVNGRHGNTQYIDGVCTNVQYDDIDELWYINDVYEPNITVKAWMPLPSYEDAPTIDRPQGKWIKRFGSINCSVCKHCSWSESFEHTVRRFKFCPNCGARMDGEA